MDRKTQKLFAKLIRLGGEFSEACDYLTEGGRPYIIPLGRKMGRVVIRLARRNGAEQTLRDLEMYRHQISADVFNVILNFTDGHIGRLEGVECAGYTPYQPKPAPKETEGQRFRREVSEYHARSAS